MTGQVHGLNYLKQNDYAGAEPFWRERLRILDRMNPDDWRTFNSKSMLGASLLGQKKYADAEPLLVAGYEGMREREARIAVPNRTRLTGALERIVQLYDAWGKKDQADERRKRLAARREADQKPEIPDEK